MDKMDGDRWDPGWKYRWKEGGMKEWKDNMLEQVSELLTQNYFKVKEWTK